MKEERPKELKNEYQNKQLELSTAPRFAIWDSEGYLHQFRYIDTHSAAPTLALFLNPLLRNKFAEKQEKLKARLEKTRKGRCKSQHLKIRITPTAQKKRHSKSQVQIKQTKISYVFPLCRSGEKQRTIALLKRNVPNISSKLTENPFLPVQKTENNQTSFH